jgi:hypothetical protein
VPANSGGLSYGDTGLRPGVPSQYLDPHPKAEKPAGHDCTTLWAFPGCGSGARETRFRNVNAAFSLLVSWCFFQMLIPASASDIPPGLILFAVTRAVTLQEIGGTIFRKLWAKYLI